LCRRHFQLLRFKSRMIKYTKKLINAVMNHNSTFLCLRFNAFLFTLGIKYKIQLNWIFQFNSNTPKNSISRYISNTLWFLFRETQVNLISNFAYNRIFSVPIESKSIQNMSINNFQLDEPNSIIEINENYFCKWQNNKCCTYSRIWCNQSQSLYRFKVNSTPNGIVMRRFKNLSLHLEHIRKH